jgi:hypothetical protein
LNFPQRCAEYITFSWRNQSTNNCRYGNYIFIQKHMMKRTATLFLISSLLLAAKTTHGQWVAAPDNLISTFTNTAVAWEDKVFFTGGALTQYVTASPYNKAVEMLDLQTGLVTKVGELLVSKCGVGAVAHNGKIYFAGGHRWISAAPGLQLFAHFDIYNVAAQTWEHKTIPTAKTWFGMAVVKGKILLAGGYVKVGSEIKLTATVDVFDPVTEAWSTMQLSEARGELSVGVIGNKVWFCGGQRSYTIWDASSRVDAYDADFNLWTQAELSTARAYTATATVGKYLICAGGYTNTQGSTNRVDILDTQDSIWQTATLSEPRFAIAAAALGSKAYFTGGGNLNLSISYYDKSSKKVDVFDGETGQFLTPQELNLNRVAHACAAGCNKIAVGGGWRAEQEVTTGHIEILTDSTLDDICFPSAANEAAQPKFSIYPNPASQTLNIQFTEGSPWTDRAVALLFHPSGRAVLRQAVSGSSATLDLSGLQPGMYFLKVDTGHGWRAEKVLVQ